MPEHYEFIRYMGELNAHIKTKIQERILLNEMIEHRRILTIAALNLILVGVEMAESYLTQLPKTDEISAIATDLMAIEQSINVIKHHIQQAKDTLNETTKE